MLNLTRSGDSMTELLDTKTNSATCNMLPLTIKKLKLCGIILKLKEGTTPWFSGTMVKSQICTAAAAGLLIALCKPRPLILFIDFPMDKENSDMNLLISPMLKVPIPSKNPLLQLEQLELPSSLLHPLLPELLELSSTKTNSLPRNLVSTLISFDKLICGYSTRYISNLNLNPNQLFFNSKLIIKFV